jgi:ribonuclease HII
MPDLTFEMAVWSDGSELVAGVDEAGRGCLAGPVVAAAVILRRDADIPGLNDSKLLTPEEREEVFPLIREQALCIGLGQCMPDEIDRLNILWAAMEAMRRAVEELAPAPGHLLIDGDRGIPNCRFPQRPIVGGDAQSLSIAAASVVAKVTRDRLMARLDVEYPQYGFLQHKGYATEGHYAALAAHGPSPHHRRTFRLA